MAALVVVAVGGAWLASGEADEGAGPVAAAPADAVEAAPVEAAPVEAAPVEAAPVEAAPVEAAPVEAPPAAVEAPPAAPPAPARAAAPVRDPAIVTPVEHPAALATRAPAGAAAAPTVSARCLGAPGAVVGWWYAGTSSPGVQGATIRLVGSVNVRDDYPREENQYSMRSTVLCWLSAGTQQRLSGAPVDIGRGQWWVPVAGGDL
jgi:hypothetical protein